MITEALGSTTSSVLQHFWNSLLGCAGDATRYDVMWVCDMPCIRLNLSLAQRHMSWPYSCWHQSLDAQMQRVVDRLMRQASYLWYLPVSSSLVTPYGCSLQHVWQQDWQQCGCVSLQHFSDSMSSLEALSGFKIELDLVLKIIKDYTHLTNAGKTIKLWGHRRLSQSWLY